LRQAFERMGQIICAHCIELRIRESARLQGLLRKLIEMTRNVEQAIRLRLWNLLQEVITETQAKVDPPQMGGNGLWGGGWSRTAIDFRQMVERTAAGVGSIGETKGKKRLMFCQGCFGFGQVALREGFQFTFFGARRLSCFEACVNVSYALRHILGFVSGTGRGSGWSRRLRGDHQRHADCANTRQGCTLCDHPGSRTFH